MGAADAETRKYKKYTGLRQNYFVPIAVETLRAVGPDATAFVKNLGAG